MAECDQFVEQRSLMIAECCAVDDEDLGVVVAVVDHQCPLPRKELVALAGRHEVVVVQVNDPLLERGVVEGGLPVVDAEVGRMTILRNPPPRSRTRTPPGVDLVQLRTDADYLPEVQSMLKARENRRVH